MKSDAWISVQDEVIYIILHKTDGRKQKRIKDDNHN